MSPERSARSQMNVPPRFSLRTTGDTFGLDGLRHQFSQDDLLGEILRPDDDARAGRACGQGPGEQDDDREAGDDGDGRDVERGRASRAEPMLEPRQATVGQERQRRRGNRSGENRRALDHRQSAKDVLAEPARADGGRNRGRAHADHRGDPEAGHDRRQRQRQLHHEQQLSRRHAHGDAGVDDRRVEAFAARRPSCERSAGAHRASASRARCAVRRRR